MKLVKQILNIFKKKGEVIEEQNKPPLTEEKMWVWWPAKEGTEESDGISVWGYWKDKICTKLLYPKSIWSGSTEFQESIFFDENNKEPWNVLLWDILIVDWPKPEEWEDILKKTLIYMYQLGALVTWCGLDVCYTEPPIKLFDPKEMSSKDIYAAYSKEFGFKCTAYLGQPYKGFTDEDMLKLKTLIE